MSERPSPASGLERLIEAYDEEFRASMYLDADKITDSGAIAAVLRELPERARHAAETLLIGVGAGEKVPDRLRALVERDGEDLWRAGLLLPSMTPSPGATIDPRHYAAACRTNGSIVSYQVLEALRESDDLHPHAPASDARWDAIVVAAGLENEPAALTREGAIRKDVERRFIASFGGDPNRWELALAMARATGLARPAGNRLFGFPESNPRPLTEAVLLLEEEGPARAGSALMRVVGKHWIRLDRMLDYLEQHCPEVLTSDEMVPWEEREGAWFREAADVLHRAGVIDATRGPEGVEAVRTAGPPAPRPPGFMLTPDRDILLAPWELSAAEYGRLCRIAPYQDGDVVCRHSLSRDGIAADIAAGYEDAIDWLEERSRTGLPDNVRSNLEEWAKQAVRVTLYSGVTVLEEDGKFIIGPEKIPSKARMLYYDEPPPAKFLLEDGVVKVPFGQDALTVRSVVSKLGEVLEPEERAHRWSLAPVGVDDPDGLLDELRRYHDGELPGELEAAVHAAAGRTDCRLEEAVVIHLPPQAAPALRRDRIAAQWLGRPLADGQCVVDRKDLPALRERLETLGFVLPQE